LVKAYVDRLRGPDTTPESKVATSEHIRQNHQKDTHRKHVMNSMSDKPRINFSRDGQRIAVIGTDLIVKMTKKRKWPCHGIMLCFAVT